MGKSRCYPWGVGVVSVLLIEDDEYAREVLAGVLEASGLTVATARTGDEAVELLDQGCSYDLLLTDIALPGAYDGWSVAVEARRQNPRIGVIYVSASHQQKCPVTRSVFLRKPLKPKLLLEIVGTLLGRALRLPAGQTLPQPEARIGSANYLH